MRSFRGVPLARLRERFMAGNEGCGADVRALREDPRSGARALADALEARRTRRLAERRRLRGLFRDERNAWRDGARRIAGVDEVGMGPLAGPVVAAAVVFPPGAVDLDALRGLDDSKKVERSHRERLDVTIRECALAVAVGCVSPAEVDRVNVYHAGLLAMRRALAAISDLDLVLVDARTVPGCAAPQRALIGGDARVAAIAAASIVAKVWRDRRMAELDGQFPHYGFASNAGYGTAEHLRELRRRGPTPVHRRSFAPVARAARRGPDAAP